MLGVDIMRKLPPELASIVASAVEKAVKAYDAGHRVDLRVQTIAELWEDAWSEHGPVKIKSWDKCASHWRQLKLFFGNIPWTECTPAKAADFHVMMSKTVTKKFKRTPTPTYVDRMLSTLHSMLNFHVQRGTTAHNPLSGFERVDHVRFARQTYLTHEEFYRFIQCGPPLFQDVMTVAFLCAGMRNSEARELLKEEVSFEQMTITLSPARCKNKRSRVIPFPEEVSEILHRHMEYSRGPYVFVKPYDPARVEHVSQSTFHRWLEMARTRSGMVGVNGEKIFIHTARHSGVTKLIQDGAPVPFVQRAAGLSDSVLPRYTKYQKFQHDILREFMGRRGPRRSDNVGDSAPETAKTFSVKQK